MHFDRNAAPVVADGNGTVRVNRHLNARAVACQMLVDGVVEHLKNAVMQPPLIGVSDVHAGAFANGFQALQLVDLSGTVNFSSCGILFLGNIAVVERNDRFGRWVFGHGRCGRF